MSLTTQALLACGAVAGSTSRSDTESIAHYWLLASGSKFQRTVPVLSPSGIDLDGLVSVQRRAVVVVLHPLCCVARGFRAGTHSGLIPSTGGASIHVMNVKPREKYRVICHR
ncbi:hypothetical protein ASH00_15490 [Arthrobacter sp. Soil782]|nr:hypothetical protein ASH00_15490 [Arthrobacter sp. Soil782]